jgi:hypothetical protein
MGGTCVSPFPAQCFMSSNLANAPWTVCRADASTAWISHAAAGGGTFQALQICQSLGYTRVNRSGGTCGNVCGYCQPATTSCSMTGNATFDGSGGDGPGGAALQFTVMWECGR